MTDKPTKLGLPSVGSVWRAGDGRVMRIDAWERKPADNGYRARLTVLNAGTSKRKQTTMGLSNFWPGEFMTQESETDAR